MQYLYLIKCQQFYKIGIANNVETRLAQLSTGNPYPLEVEIIYAFENAEVVERAIHQRYKETRQRGEWFSLDYDALKNIHSICLMLGGRAFEYTGASATDEVIERTEKMIEESEWLELVKVKKWTYVRLMRWDAVNNKKEYIKHIGTLDECKRNPFYAAEAIRLEKNLKAGTE